MVTGLVIAKVLHFLVERTVPEAHFVWWLLPSLLAVACIYILSGNWTGGRGFRQQVKTDLAGGAVAVHRIDAVDAIEVEEHEDEGPSYFLRTTGGLTILFSGQYLDSYKRKGFPWKSFEMIEAPKSKVFFGLKELADRLKPSFIRQPFTSDELKQFRCKKYVILKNDFESLKVKEVRMSEISAG